MEGMVKAAGDMAKDTGGGTAMIRNVQARADGDRADSAVTIRMKSISAAADSRMVPVIWAVPIPGIPQHTRAITKKDPRTTAHDVKAADPAPRVIGETTTVILNTVMERCHAVEI